MNLSETKHNEILLWDKYLTVINPLLKNGYNAYKVAVKKYALMRAVVIKHYDVPYCKHQKIGTNKATPAEKTAELQQLMLWGRVQFQRLTADTKPIKETVEDKLLKLYQVETQLKAVGYAVGFEEEDAYIWIVYPDGTLEVTEKDLLGLHGLCGRKLVQQLRELRTERELDFRPSK